MKHWSSFFSNVWTTFATGFDRPGPFLYFISIIVIAGGVGIWFPWISSGIYDDNSIMTYVFALLAASIADYLIGSNTHKDNKDISIAVITFVVFVIAVTILSVIVDHCLLKNILRGLSLLLLWALWWFLLDHTRFDIDRKTIANATIGADSPQSDIEETGLSAFQRSRSTQS